MAVGRLLTAVVNCGYQLLWSIAVGADDGGYQGTPMVSSSSWQRGGATTAAVGGGTIIVAFVAFVACDIACDKCNIACNIAFVA